MVLKFYLALLRLPQFKGKSRVIQFYRTLFFPTHRISGTYGFVMELDPIDWIQSELLRAGLLESLTSTLYKKLLHQGDKMSTSAPILDTTPYWRAAALEPRGRLLRWNPSLTSARSFWPTGAPMALKIWRYMSQPLEKRILPFACVNRVESDTSRLSLCLEPVQ
jgi:hypothetical protein